MERIVMDQKTLSTIIKDVKSLLGPEEQEKDAAGLYLPNAVDAMAERRVVQKILARLKAYAV
jgi:hypothetical protein